MLTRHPCSNFGYLSIFSFLFLSVAWFLISGEGGFGSSCGFFPSSSCRRSFRRRSIGSSNRPSCWIVRSPSYCLGGLRLGHRCPDARRPISFWYFGSISSYVVHGWCVVFWHRVQVRFYDCIRFLVLFEPLEGFDSFDVHLDNNESVKNPHSILDFSTDLSVFYSIKIGYYVFKIDMSTCRSVQVDSLLCLLSSAAVSVSYV